MDSFPVKKIQPMVDGEVILTGGLVDESNTIKANKGIVICPGPWANNVLSMIE